MLVRRSLDALGGPTRLEHAGGVILEGRGTYDLGARLQGRRPNVPQPVVLEEHLAVVVDARGPTRVALESRMLVNPDAEEWIRTIADGSGRALLIDRLAARAFRIGGGDGDDESRRRVARAVPHVLLAEALAAPERLRFEARGEVMGVSVDEVEVRLASGPALTLLLDAHTALLRGVQYSLTLPLRGETLVRWWYEPYRDVDALGVHPAGYAIWLGDDLLRRVRFTSIRAGAGASPLFGIPDGIMVPSTPSQVTPPAPPTPAAPAAPSPAPRPDVRTIAPGVYLAPNVRTGFHHLFVELGESVLVVDAPARWHELREIPAISGAPDAAVGSLGQRLLDVVRATIPDKPVRYLVLTHHHDDHAGGMQPFIEAGATIIASAATRPVIDATVAGARVEIVGDTLTIADSTREVRVIDVGENPHADGMLAVWLSNERILFVADLWEPASERNFPSPARTPVMRWFVDWLDRSGLQPDQILAMHGSARVTPGQIATIRALPPERR